MRQERLPASKVNQYGENHENEPAQTLISNKHDRGELKNLDQEVFRKRKH